MNESSNYSNMLHPLREAAAPIGQLAAKVAYYNFEWRFVTLVMYYTMKAVGLTTFLTNYEKPVVLKYGQFLAARKLPVPQIVIFGNDHLEISKALDFLTKIKYDTNAKYLIVCTSLKTECDENYIFKTIQKHLIINVIVLKSSLFTSEFLSYTYQIVMPGKCINNVPFKINLNTDCINNKCFKNLYKSQLRNFYQCRIRLSTVEQPPFMYLYNGTKEPAGIDGEIMAAVASFLNGTLFLQTPHDAGDSGHFINNNWTGSLGDIYNGRTQASVCASPLTVLKYDYFQISYTYYSMDVVWVTKLPAQRSSWEKLVRPLNIYLQVSLVFMFIGIILMNVLCKTNVCRDVGGVFEMEPPKYSLCFYSWVLFLGMPILREPANRSYLVTIYTWIWFCFLVRCVYQVALIHSLKQTSYDQNIQNFDEVLQSGLPFGGQQALKEYFSEDPEIYSNWQVIPLNHLFGVLDDLLDGESDYVVATNKEVMKRYLLKFKGLKKLQILPHKIVNSPLVVYFRKYSPLTDPISYALRVAFEGGFVHRAFEKYVDNDKALLKRDSYEVESLNMGHFAGIFLLLLAGMFISCTYFVVEWICGNLKDE